MAKTIKVKWHCNCRLASIPIQDAYYQPTHTLNCATRRKQQLDLAKDTLNRKRTVHIGLPSYIDRMGYFGLVNSARTFSSMKRMLGIEPRNIREQIRTRQDGSVIEGRKG